MTLYQPLDPAKNEIRLLYFKLNYSYLRSSTATEKIRPQRILRMDMSTISLYAYTKKSLEFLNASG